MSGKPAYLLIAQVPAGSLAWDRVLLEIPAGAVLRSVEVAITHTEAHVNLRWVGHKPDGTPHLRTTLQTVLLSEDLGGRKFLYEAFGDEWAETFESLMP